MTAQWRSFLLWHASEHRRHSAVEGTPICRELLWPREAKRDADRVRRSFRHRRRLGFGFGRR